MNDQAESLRRLVASRSTRSKARVITVTSGKGGVGKTNLAVNLAISMSRLGLHTGLLDGDLGLANVDIIFGIAPEYHLGHVIYGEKSLDQILIKGPEGVTVFAGGSGVYELANLSQWLLQRFIRSIDALDTELDVLILDTGAGISRNVMNFVLASDEVIVVTTPELTAITDAYRIIKLAISRNPKAQVCVVVNMARDEKQALHVIRSIRSVVQQFIQSDSHVELLGYVPLDPAVGKAVGEQCPVLISYPASKAARSVEAIARRLIFEDTAVSTGGISGLFQRMAATVRKKRE